MVSCSGSLVPLCYEEGGALQTNLTGLCGEHSRFSSHIGFAPARGGCVCFPCLHCSGSRLLSREWALRCVDFPGLRHSVSGFQVFHKSTDSVGPAFCAFPGQSSSGSQELEECTLSGCGAPSPLCSPSLSFCAHQSGAPCVSSGELDSSCDLPSRYQPSRISRKSLLRSWKPVCSLVGMPSLGPGLPLSPPPCLLPLVEDGPVLCWLALLWHSLSPLFWEPAGSA